MYYVLLPRASLYYPNTYILVLTPDLYIFQIILGCVCATEISIVIVEGVSDVVVAGLVTS